MKKFFLILFTSLISCLLILYLFILYGLPLIINSQSFNDFLEQTLSKQINNNLSIEKLNLKITPNLLFDLSVDEIKILNANKKTGADTKKIFIKADLKKLQIENIKIDSVFLNKDIMAEIFKPNKKKPKSTPDLNKIPNISIKNLDIQSNDKKSFFANSKNIEIIDKGDQKNISLNLEFKTCKLIHSIYLGKSGNLYIKNNELYANNYTIKLDKNSTIVLNGNILNKDKSSNFEITGKNIPMADTMQMMLYAQKYGVKERKFVENFKNFKGYIDLNVKYNKGNFDGIIVCKNATAVFIFSNLPVSIKKGVFYLKNQTVTSYIEGIFAGEKISHKLLIKEITNKKKKEVFGEVKFVLSQKNTNNYLIKDIRIKNKVNVKINYYIKNKCPKANYDVIIPENSNIRYKDYYFGDMEKHRRLLAETYKKDSNFNLNYYKYFVNDAELINGKGFFLSQNGNMNPQYVTLKTNDYADNTILGSFSHYVNGGKFKGNLVYNFIREEITGDFEVIDTVFNDFYTKSALVKADKNYVQINAMGLFKKQNFRCNAKVKNNFKDRIYVKRLDLFLDKYIIRQPYHRKRIHNKQNILLEKPNEKISSAVRKINMDIDSWNVEVNLLQVKKMKFTNIELNGSIKNSLLKFIIKNLQIAEGKIYANGSYDFNNDISILDFNAQNIDSNVIATELFNLPNQVNGIASATLHSETNKHWEHWIANTHFKIDDGKLPQLENVCIKNKRNSKKKISDIVKTKSKSTGAIKSKITADFKWNDYKISDLEIKFQHEFLSFLVNGTYEPLKNNMDIDMLGKYNIDVSKNTNIFKIPLNWIINILIPTEKFENIDANKLNKIPQIACENKKQRFFHVNLLGNPTSKDFKYSAKRIK